MEMKVLCKSDACLAMCQITRGLRYIAFKWVASENWAATPNRPKTQYCTKSLKRTQHISERFSYFTQCTPTKAIKVINNPTFMITDLCSFCSKNALLKLHKTNTCVMNSLFSVSSRTKPSARVRTASVSGFPVRHHTDILWRKHATDVTLRNRAAPKQWKHTSANLMWLLFISLILCSFTTANSRCESTINCKTDMLLQYKKTFTDTWFTSASYSWVYFSKS